MAISKGTQYITNPKTMPVKFNSIQEMISYKFLKVGDTVETSGYYESGDGGGNQYLIVEASSGVDDGGGHINLGGISGQAKGVFAGSINVLQFGAKGDGVDDDTVFLQNSMDYAAKSKLPLKLPGGDFTLSETLFVPSNLNMSGAGRDVTWFKSFSDVERRWTSLLVGWEGNKVEDVYLSDFSIDYNVDRWKNANGSGLTNAIGVNNLDRSCLAIGFAERVDIERVNTYHAHSHGINVGAQYNNKRDPEEWDVFGSRFVRVTDCEGAYHRDDAFTTHMCSDVWFTRCVGRDAARAEDLDGIGIPQPIGIEIDDGSRNIFIHNCEAYRCLVGLSIKRHDGAPPAYNITITGGFKSVNCFQSFNFSMGAEAGSNSRAIIADKLISIAPTGSYNTAFGGKQADKVNHVRFVEAKNIHIGLIYAIDDRLDIGNKEVLYPQDKTSPRRGVFLTRSSGVTIDHIYMEGSFATEDLVIVQNRSEDITLGSVDIVDCVTGNRGVNSSSTTKNVYLGTHRVQGTGPTGIRLHGDGSFIQGPGEVKGFDKSYLDCFPSRPDVSRAAVFSPHSRHLYRIGWSMSALDNAGYGIDILDRDGEFVSTALTIGRTGDSPDYFSVGVPHDNSIPLGRASARWSEVFSGNGTINTSDEREKQQIRDISETEKLVAAEIKENLKSFKWNDAVNKKGDHARWHFGVLAQDVVRIFEKHNLDPFSYGLLCHDTWEEESEMGGETTSETLDRYGIRYDQLMVFLISSM